LSALRDDTARVQPDFAMHLRPPDKGEAPEPLDLSISLLLLLRPLSFDEYQVDFMNKSVMAHPTL